MSKGPRIYEHIERYLRAFSREGGKVLELGCGGKQYCRCFQRTYWGLDLHDSYYPGDKPDITGDAQALPIRSESVDLVFFVATLCAIPDPEKTLAECHRVLKIGGRVVVFDYNWWVSRRLKDAHHHFSSFSLAQRLRRQGFSPRIHWLCAPRKGPAFLRSVLDSGMGRLLTYCASNWIVLSGRKTASSVV